MNIDQVAVIVQARLGSQRIPKKMIWPFAGTTLLDIIFRKLVVSEFIPKKNLIFAAYEPELLRIAEKYEIETFVRSEKSANAEVSLTDIYEWHDKLPSRFTDVVLVSGCSPLLEIETIDHFVKTYINGPPDHHGLFGVIEKKQYYWDTRGYPITQWPKGVELMNTKLVAPLYEAAHCLYASKLNTIKHGVWMGSFRKAYDPAIYIMPEEECFDIDYQWQFEVAEVLYQRMQKK